MSFSLTQATLLIGLLAVCVTFIWTVPAIIVAGIAQVSKKLALVVLLLAMAGVWVVEPNVVLTKTAFVTVTLTAHELFVYLSALATLVFVYWPIRLRR